MKLRLLSALLAAATTFGVLAVEGSAACSAGDNGDRSPPKPAESQPSAPGPGVGKRAPERPAPGTRRAIPPHHAPTFM